MDPAKFEKLLVIKFWGIGSLVLAEPFFRATRERFPNAEIHVLTLSSNRAVKDLIPAIDQFHFVDLGGNTLSAIGVYVRTMWTVFRAKYDVVMDMEFYTRASAVMSLAAWSPVRIGYHAPGIYRGSIQSHQIPFNNYWPVSRNFLSLLEPYGGTTDDVDIVPSIHLSAELDDDARAVLDTLGGADAAHYVVINVNAGELAFERRWFPERFADLAARLGKAFDIDCVFIGAPAERDYVQAVVEDARNQGARAHNTAGELGLASMAQVCKRARLVISNDSGPLHVAAATGVPVVGFFGPETPVLYGPMGEGHMAFHQSISCSPCINVEQGKRIKCRFDVPKCQLANTVDDAFEAISTHYDKRLSR